ncbi:hypothetical protein CEY09_30095 [Achromobacter marplatensis]|uniref:Uncharacterized protein n=1 Tax=Achromobacter marplatensis TaxID=470868 RepID=A0ABX9G0B6_9BURK|nr:hypothetical protein [Achromobacter marplatensis]OWT55543.1 hypothetical protein CEY09_30095 [Achromobacter marplatensis]RBP11300.1 hypothetical protein DFP87_12361 [Achromobacter marplatensis]CAB3711746.1 hypothetical protein LMG26219_05963 [Achromobacter marplatensis]
MIRRLLRALLRLDRHDWVGAACAVVFIGGIVVALGDRQQRDEQAQSTLTAKDDGRPTAYASKD